MASTYSTSYGRQRRSTSASDSGLTAGGAAATCPVSLSTTRPVVGSTVMPGSPAGAMLSLRLADQVVTPAMITPVVRTAVESVAMRLLRAERRARTSTSSTSVVSG
ncbi:hypothetical protein [Kribbella sp. NPDC048915]|uniref:hypothetical protein n=1 Tax=Kribbella sp. NPDC048915 TaxID=3155148 RepID=UPI0033E024F5